MELFLLLFHSFWTFYIDIVNKVIYITALDSNKFFVSLLNKYTIFAFEKSSRHEKSFTFRIVLIRTDLFVLCKQIQADSIHSFRNGWHLRGY